MLLLLLADDSFAIEGKWLQAWRHFERLVWLLRPFSILVLTEYYVNDFNSLSYYMHKKVWLFLFMNYAIACITWCELYVSGR